MSILSQEDGCSDQGRCGAAGVIAYEGSHFTEGVGRDIRSGECESSVQGVQWIAGGVWALCGGISLCTSSISGDQAK